MKKIALLVLVTIILGGGFYFYQKNTGQNSINLNNVGNFGEGTGDISPSTPSTNSDIKFTNQDEKPISNGETVPSSRK